MSQVVSIIVPVFNCERYLPRTLESLSNQSYGNLDIILVDDGSQDGSGALCDAVCEQDCRFRVIHQLNRGPGEARNAGLQVARGECIGFVDGGDYIHVEAVERMLHALGDSSADFALTDVFFTENLTEDIRRPLKEAHGEFIVQQDLVYKMLTSSGRAMMPWAVVWNKLYRRSLLEGISFKNYLCNEDQDFNVQVYLKARKAVYLHQPLYYYMHVPGSIIHNPETKFKRLCVHTASRFAMLDYFQGDYAKLYKGWLLDYLYRDLLVRRGLLKASPEEKVFQELSSSIVKNSLGQYLSNPYIPIKKKMKFLVYWVWKR